LKKSPATRMTGSGFKRKLSAGIRSRDLSTNSCALKTRWVFPDKRFFHSVQKINFKEHMEPFGDY
jgi:hypothetical protein